MRQAWPEAIFAGNQGGSTTNEIFCLFMERCFLKPMREIVDVSLPLILLLDSGGGTWLHLSVKFIGLCCKYNCRPRFLEAYTTRALCALDQTVHSQMAQQWKEFKRSWKSSLNLYQALAALRGICSESLKHNEASWKQCGFEINKELNRDRLLVDRSAELFSSEQNATKRKPEVSTRVLELVHKVAPKRKRCEECNSWNLANHKFCPHCQSPNKNFDPETFQIHRDGRRGQWQKNAEAEEPDCLDDATVTAVTDILKELRSRTNKKSKTDGTCPEPSTEAAPSSTDVAPAAPDPEDEVEAGEPGSPEEWDMSKPSHCVEIVCHMFPMEEASKMGFTDQQFTQVAEYYVNNVLAKKTPKQPLAVQFRSELDKGTFKGAANRRSWLKTMSGLRSGQYMQKPKK